MACIGTGVSDLKLQIAHAGVEEVAPAPGWDVEHDHLAGVKRGFIVGRLVLSHLARRDGARLRRVYQVVVEAHVGVDCLPC